MKITGSIFLNSNYVKFEIEGRYSSPSLGAQVNNNHSFFDLEFVMRHPEKNKRFPKKRELEKPKFEIKNIFLIFTNQQQADAFFQKYTNIALFVKKDLVGMQQGEVAYCVARTSLEITKDLKKYLNEQLSVFRDPIITNIKNNLAKIEYEKATEAQLAEIKKLVQEKLTVEFFNDFFIPAKIKLDINQYGCHGLSMIISRKFIDQIAAANLKNCDIPPVDAPHIVYSERQQFSKIKLFGMKFSLSNVEPKYRISDEIISYTLQNAEIVKTKQIENFLAECFKNNLIDAIEHTNLYGPLVRQGANSQIHHIQSGGSEKKYKTYIYSLSLKTIKQVAADIETIIENNNYVESTVTYDKYEKYTGECRWLVIESDSAIECQALIKELAKVLINNKILPQEYHDKFINDAGLEAEKKEVKSLAKLSYEMIKKTPIAVFPPELREKFYSTVHAKNKDGKTITINTEIEETKELFIDYARFDGIKNNSAAMQGLFKIPGVREYLRKNTHLIGVDKEEEVKNINNNLSRKRKKP